MLENGGELITRIIPDRTRKTIWPLIWSHVLLGSIIHTDELQAYGSISQRGYRHQTVCHAANEYVGKNGQTVNDIEASGRC